MTAKQFNSILDKLGLSQLAAARMLGIDGRTARRYVAGVSTIPEPTAKLLRLALAGRLTPEEIQSS